MADRRTHKRLNTGDTAASGSDGDAEAAAAPIPFDVNVIQNQTLRLQSLFDSARVAYARPWHRLERGLRLNRIRQYVDELGPYTPAEKEQIYQYLQKQLDKKQLNTVRIVSYDPELQKITSIRGFEVRRGEAGAIRCGFVVKKRVDATRRRKDDGAGAGGTTTSDLKSTGE